MKKMIARILIAITSFFIFKFSVAQNNRQYKSSFPFADSSKSIAGFPLRFNTDADEIIVKYTIAEHPLPAQTTERAVSGIDLFCKTIDGKWLYTQAQQIAGDTIVYRYKNLAKEDGHVNNRQYFLYLPIYSVVKWMEITTPKESFFKQIPARNEKPIVVYGTSFLKKGCTSNPGFFWTNILSRKLDRPIVNLSFCDKKKAQKDCIELLAEANAKIYLLDFLIDLIPGNNSNAEFNNSIAAAVKRLQVIRPGTPILLTENALVNNTLKKVYDSLLAAGVKNIYLFTKNEIEQHKRKTIDSLQLKDVSGMEYANILEKKIRMILKEPAGDISTTIPVTQRRDAASYDWETRHNQVLTLNKTFNPKIVFIGNSITHYWGGQPVAPYSNGAASWKKYFEDWHVINMGFGWDRIENVLWRVHHGELDNIAPKQIVVMIGTNNLQYNSDDEIVKGLQFLIKAIRLKQPLANILLMGILPRKDMETRIAKLNKMIAKQITSTRVRYSNAGILFLKKDKKIDESLFSDGLHPNAKGYEKLGAFINMLLLKK
jgi:lysophospholipase L1-like esterase